MQQFFKFLFIACFLVSCGQEKTPVSGETEWQKEMNARFKDASKSPLKEKDFNS